MTAPAPTGTQLEEIRRAVAAFTPHLPPCVTVAPFTLYRVHETIMYSLNLNSTCTFFV